MLRRSQRLRLRDVRNVFRAVGECRELRRDREAWMRHAVEAVRSLTPARAGATGFHPPDGFQHTRDTRAPTDIGFDRSEHSVFIEYHLNERFLEDPCFRRYLEIRRPDLTIRTRRFASAAEVRRSGLWDWARAMGTGDHLFSQRRVWDGRSCLGFSIWTPHAGAPFERRDARLVRLLNAELARLVGRVLSDGTDPISSLPPRLRKTLERLLAGDSEKQAALALGLSKSTVHEYVGLLYRRFGVNSRSELIVECVHRSAKTEIDRQAEAKVTGLAQRNAADR